MMLEKEEPAIRRSTQEDTRALLQLMQELGYALGEDELLLNIDAINQRNGIILVAEVRGNVVGCLSAVINASLAEGIFGEIVSLVVSSEFRAAGIGRRLVERAEDWFKPAVKKIRIRANSLRVEAHTFYRALGYKAVKTQISFIKYL